MTTDPTTAAPSRRRRVVALFLTLLVMIVPLGGSLAMADTTPSVSVLPPDVVAQFQALKHHGEALGWVLPEDEGAPDPSVADHYQGVVRHPGTGTPVFYVTQLDDDDPVLPGAPDKGGYLLVARMPSRPTTGERLGSNLQRLGRDTSQTSPPDSDRWVRSIRFDGSVRIGETFLPAYQHPGGMAVVDDVLFMALDQPRTKGAPPGQLVLFDLRPDRLDPRPLAALPLDHGIDNIGVVTEPDGTQLVWVNGEGGSATRFYRTSKADLRDPDLALVQVQDWDPSSPADRDGRGKGWPTGNTAYQGSGFVEQADGTRFLVMMHRDGLVFGDDYADLYRVDAKTGGGFKLTRVASKHMFCDFDGSGHICHFLASGAVHTSPSGELILYSVPHDDQDDFDPDFVRMAEFRHRDSNREGSPLRLPRADAGGPREGLEGDGIPLQGVGAAAADGPWVELYDDDTFADRSIVVDYHERHLLELENFERLDNFGDKTSSVRWRLPVGLDVELHEHDHFGGRRVVLKGTGRTQSITDLSTQVVVPGVVEHPGRSAGERVTFGDTTSSLRFVGAPPNATPNLSWDLDGDGVFGETGPGATRGDEVGPSPVFSAAHVDGPATFSVRLRVTSAGTTVEDAATLSVHNRNPHVTIEALSTDATGVALIGVPVTLDGRFTDVPADTHTATIAWGDGNSGAGAVDQSTGTVIATHAYAAPGDVAVRLTVTDDDGGSGTDERPLTVVDARGGGVVAADRLAEALAAATEPLVRQALADALEALVGKGVGADASGAVDRFADGDLVAALQRIEQAIGALLAAEAAGGGDFDAEKTLLGRAAWSAAEGMFADLAGAIGPEPSRGDQRKLAAVRALIDEGIARLGGGDHLGAAESFRAAVQRAI